MRHPTGLGTERGGDAPPGRSAASARRGGVGGRVALLLSGCISACVVVAEELRLEGVNILGASKSAYIRVDGLSSRLREGEVVAGWRVHSIGNRAVELRRAEGETRTLLLDHTEFSPAPAVAKESPESSAPPPSDVAVKPRVIAPPPPEKTGEGTYHINPRFVKEEEIPAGFKRVRTPFGDFLVEEENTK